MTDDELKRIEVGRYVLQEELFDLSNQTFENYLKLIQALREEREKIRNTVNFLELVAKRSSHQGSERGPYTAYDHNIEGQIDCAKRALAKLKGEENGDA